MGSNTEQAPAEKPEVLLRGVYTWLNKLEVEIVCLRDAKNAAEAELARSKKTVEEQAAELASLKQKLGKGEGPFVASATRKKFHRPKCKYAGDVITSDHARYYLTREEAIDAGYKPCSTCCS